MFNIRLLFVCLLQLLNCAAQLRRETPIEAKQQRSLSLKVKREAKTLMKMEGLLCNPEAVSSRNTFPSGFQLALHSDQARWPSKYFPHGVYFKFSNPCMRFCAVTHQCPLPPLPQLACLFVYLLIGKGTPTNCTLFPTHIQKQSIFVPYKKLRGK